MSGYPYAGVNRVRFEGYSLSPGRGGGPRRDAPSSESLNMCCALPRSQKGCFEDRDTATASWPGTDGSPIQGGAFVSPHAPFPLESAPIGPMEIDTASVVCRARSRPNDRRGPIGTGPALRCTSGCFVDPRHTSLHCAKEALNMRSPWGRNHREARSIFVACFLQYKRKPLHNCYLHLTGWQNPAEEPSRSESASFSAFFSYGFFVRKRFSALSPRSRAVSQES